MILEKIKEKFLDDIYETREFRGDLVAVINKEIVTDLMAFLKEDSFFDFNILMDLTAVDYLGMGRIPRFDVVYHLYSLAKNHRLRVKAGVDEKEPSIDSLTSIWPIADWFEREVWDMFGIKFKGHPNLKRILMYDEFEGHPLRKDYPYNKRQPLIGPKN
ncbi:MAG: NADH-quinone oxidoreductase subunit C [Candidatus Omnitrophica bacterium]|nr:NADH-quinone oxidoreductase subunit C [Candidatus Omnitrophota bacterium]